MIARELRFRGYNALRMVYRQGRVVRVPMATVRLVPNQRRQRYRLAVVVSKKISKSAVVRNRIRRRLFEAGREVLPPKTPYDIVVTVGDEQIIKQSQKDIKNIFLRILQIVEKSEQPVEKHNREQI